MIWNGKIVELYDLWWKRDTERELPFWKNVSSEYLKTRKGDGQVACIVELFSGTGRILIPLAQYLSEEFPDLRLKAIGLDYSRDMNNWFKNRISKIEDGLKERISIVAHKLDLRSKDWSRVLGDLKVDVFIIPFNHLGLMGDPGAQENLVKNVSHYLVQGGLFVLVDYNPKTRREEDNRQEKLFRRMIADEKKNRALFYWRKSNPIDKNHSCAQVTYCVECVEWKEGSISVESFPMSMTIHYNSPGEIDSLLAKYGLKVEKRLGDPEDIGSGRPEFFEDRSHSQTVLARK